MPCSGAHGIGFDAGCPSDDSSPTSHGPTPLLHQTIHMPFLPQTIGSHLPIPFFFNLMKNLSKLFWVFLLVLTRRKNSPKSLIPFTCVLKVGEQRMLVLLVSLKEGRVSFTHSLITLDEENYYSSYRKIL